MADPDTTGATATGDGATALSPDDAKAQLAALENDAANVKILLDSADPQHTALIEKRDALARTASGKSGLPAEAEQLSETGYDDDIPADLREGMERSFTPPAEPGDYDLDRVIAAEDDTPDQFKEGKEMVAGWAHDAGLTEGEIVPIIESYNTLMRDEGRHDPAAIETAQGDAVSTLRALWKENFDEKFLAAQQEAERLGEDFAYFLDETRLGDDAWMIRALADAAKQRPERSARRQAAREAGQKQQPAASSVQDAKDQIAKQNLEAAADPDHPLVNKRHPGHQAAQEARHRLFLIAYPGTTGPT